MRSGFLATLIKTVYTLLFTAILFPLLLLLPSLTMLTLFKHLLSKKAVEPIPRIWIKVFMGLGGNGVGGRTGLGDTP